MKQIKPTKSVKHTIRYLKKLGIYGDLLNSIRDILIQRICSGQINDAILYLNTCLDECDIFSLRIFIWNQDPNYNRVDILMTKLKSER